MLGNVFLSLLLSLPLTDEGARTAYHESLASWHLQLQPEKISVSWHLQLQPEKISLASSAAKKVP